MRIGIDATCWANERGYGRFTREIVTAMVAAGARATSSFACSTSGPPAFTGLKAPNVSTVWCRNPVADRGRGCVRPPPIDWQTCCGSRDAVRARFARCVSLALGSQAFSAAAGTAGGRHACMTRSPNGSRADAANAVGSWSWHARSAGVDAGAARARRVGLRRQGNRDSLRGAGESACA